MHLVPVCPAHLLFCCLCCLFEQIYDDDDEQVAKRHVMGPIATLPVGKFKAALSRYQRRRAIEALEARAPQYCDCGPDWPLLFKVHEIWSIDSQENH